MLSEISVDYVLENGTEIPKETLVRHWNWKHFAGVFNFIKLTNLENTLEYIVPIFSFCNYQIFIVKDYLVVLEKRNDGEIMIHSVLQNG